LTNGTSGPKGPAERPLGSGTRPKFHKQVEETEVSQYVGEKGDESRSGIDAMEKKIAHLTLIEAAISRMGSNSFLLKGWSVTLVAALFALAAKDTKSSVVLIAYLPCLAFWALDGYFLWQEAIFRELYDVVRVLPEDKIDFSMRNEEVANRPDWLSRAFSKTAVLFHSMRSHSETSA
jgi:hypothetical protein